MIRISPSVSRRLATVSALSSSPWSCSKYVAAATADGGGRQGAAFSKSWLRLVFNAQPIANIADNASASPLANVYISLHSADPTGAGNQTASEIAHAGYGRVAVARTTAGWNVTGNSVAPAATIIFPIGTGGTGTAAFWGVGTLASGAGVLLYSGPLSPAVVCGNGISPQITTASTITETYRIKDHRDKLDGQIPLIGVASRPGQPIVMMSRKDRGRRKAA